MAQAHMGSVEEVRDFRPALLRFGTDVSRGIGEADSGVLRALQRLDSDIPSFWRMELSKRQEKLSLAREQWRAKTMFKDSSGKSPSAVDEWAAVQHWTRAAEEAQQKIAAAKKWRLILLAQYEQFRSGVRAARDLAPLMTERAVHDFDRAVDSIEAYLALQQNQVLSSASL